VRLDTRKSSPYEDPVDGDEEDSTAISSISVLSSRTDDWVLTDHSPTTDKVCPFYFTI
jgi:hypothetical protein